MRLKNIIDYKRFPEPSRGDWTRFTILALSAEIPCSFSAGDFSLGIYSGARSDNLRKPA